jgi:hypothetical protein
MAAVAGAFSTTSDKIRALDAAGYSRAEIARFLGKLYQHVRNVLVAGPPKNSLFAQGGAEAGAAAGARTSGFEEVAAEPYAVDASIAILRLPVTEDGLIQLPPMALRTLGVKPGGVVIAELDEDHLVLFSARESVRRIQAMVRDLIPGRRGLADSLIADRRREAEADD